MIEYKGYTGVFEYAPDLDAFQGYVIGTRDQIVFEGRSPDELRSSMKEAIDGYLDWCSEEGEEPDRPYSGKFNVRITKDLHRTVATLAAREGVSLNEWIIGALEAGANVACVPAGTGSRTPAANAVPLAEPGV